MYSSKRTVARIFQLNDHKFETAQDIDLKFSVFVRHMSGVNWHKNFSFCSISGSVGPSSVQKLCTPIATIFVEKKIWKKNWCGFRPIRVTPWKEFLISWKSGILKFFKRVRNPEPVIHDLIYSCTKPAFDECIMNTLDQTT